MTTVLVAVVVIGLGVLAWSRRWMSDDGFIYLRVVQNLRAGHGPVFNAGERVEAATGPAWVALLAFADAVTPIRLEWLAIFLGIGSTVVGAAAAAAAAITMRRATTTDEQLLIPFGLLVFAAVPAVWDYATSGLETGLAFAWLGVASLLMVRWAVRPDWRSEPVPRWTAVVVGFGVLIRPDLFLFSLAFVACLLVPRVARAPLRFRIRVLSWTFALPFAYEVFRMGYYAALVPNPAFAKESSVLRWGQGYRYLRDFVGSYWLVVPAALIVIALLVLLRDLKDSRAAPARLFVFAILFASAADALYTVAVGGSHMHARLFLPSLLGVIVPVAVVPWRRARAQIPAMIGWAIVCALVLRPPLLTPKQYKYGVVDLRAVWTPYDAHPVSIESHIRPIEPKFRVITQTPNGPISAPLGLQGAIAYAYGPSLYVFDDLGLADWLTSRLPLNRHLYPDHQKFTGRWEAARLSLVTGLVPEHPDPATAAALHAFQCGDLRELREAVSDRLTLGRFFENVGDAFELSRLRIPDDPRAGEIRFCGGGR